VGQAGSLRRVANPPVLITERRSTTGAQLAKLPTRRILKLLIYYVGKARDTHANAMAEEYIKRSSRFAKCEMREIRAKNDPFEKHTSAMKVMLDPAGRAMNSAAFTKLIEQETRDIVFVLGGADGLPLEWRAKADLLISLSPLTMPHELARVVLAEQIYRALTTLRGHPYPR
jgi:23S rRNA (pseudouridine1915-N3)-methyltransferase